MFPRLSVAPMMDWTDRHFRYFFRGISRRTALYTEMVTAKAVKHGDRERLLGFDPVERPLVLQLGGDDPAELELAAKAGADYGYDGVNLNVGCPSDRVQAGRFGACLMAEPALTARLLRALAASGLPVSVKHRLGIDGWTEYGPLRDFVARLADDGGCRHFIVHARIAKLDGLSPKDNRRVPPLNYEFVYRLRADFPDVALDINGGIRDWDTIAAQWGCGLDGVMLGRAAYDDPLLFSPADAILARLGGRLGADADGSGASGGRRDADIARALGESAATEPASAAPARSDLLQRYAEYLDARGERPWHGLRHVHGLYHGQAGARAFRRYLSAAGPSARDAASFAAGWISALEAGETGGIGAA